MLSVPRHNEPMKNITLSQESYNYMTTLISRAWYEAHREEDEATLRSLSPLLKDLGMCDCGCHQF